MQEMIIVKNFKIFFFASYIRSTLSVKSCIFYIYKTYIQMKSVKIYVI